MSQMQTITPWYQREFNRYQAQAGQAPWLVNYRQQAFAAFTAQGLPKRKTEDWKYTSVKAIANGDFALADKQTDHLNPAHCIETSLYPDAPHRLFFVNGRLDHKLSSLEQLPNQTLPIIFDNPQQISVPFSPGDALPKTGHPFAHLNGALMEHAWVIRIPKNTLIEQAIHLLFVSHPGQEARLASPRSMIIVEANAKVDIVEEYVGSSSQAYPQPTFTNTLTEIHLAQGASCCHYKLQSETDNTQHISGIHVKQGKDSHYISHNIGFGGQLARTDINVSLQQQGASCQLYGLYLCDGKRHIDNHIQVDHISSHCNSEQLYKGIIDGQSRAVFNGKVLVQPHAIQTKAHQQNHNLLLSSQAEVDFKPELQIYADDVQCSHGATSGQLDNEALFYLQARGIPTAQARALLTYAFAGELVEQIKLAPLAQKVAQKVRSQLAGCELNVEQNEKAL